MNLTDELRAMRFLGEYGSAESLPEDYIKRIAELLEQKVPDAPPQNRYRICGDDSGHDYFIPVERVEDFYKWVEAEESGKPFPLDFGVNRIDGRFTFTDPKCE